MTDSAAITDRERDLRELVEAQAALASFIYVDLVNLGVLERSSAAARLKLLGGVLRSGAPESASARALADRLATHADSLAASAVRPARPAAPALTVLAGGRTAV